ncbi:hypothetical protein VCHA53P481_90021 [Vibrio chagasii]|nr:hypothetical protein VCHA31O73_310021 [Vibrio chagasii]CAH6903704.1 hypothetical protein VCHA35O141_340039 [Vibrio chagasii]CAH6908038.1 hypothetical protein VCHA35O143_340021 [Vibrio chagasii]CAH6961874.1 hypothetical protein VCHA41O246_130119 [Vibrio chagasii]CAH6983909.1 hypothetical protein VCHA36O163_50181 [Vibrio chagasii]
MSDYTVKCHIILKKLDFALHRITTGKANVQPQILSRYSR